MNQAVVIRYEVQKTDDQGIARSYEFLHPYGAPAGEAFAVLSEIYQYLQMRCEELTHAQAAAEGKVPEQKTEVTDGN